MALAAKQNGFGEKLILINYLETINFISGMCFNKTYFFIKYLVGISRRQEICGQSNQSSMIVNYIRETE